MDFYKLLNVSRSASASQIKKAFRKYALLYHPDVTGNDEAKTAKYNELYKAYETLSNEDTRYIYDAENPEPYSGAYDQSFDISNQSFRNTTFHNQKVEMLRDPPQQFKDAWTRMNSERMNMNMNMNTAGRMRPPTEKQQVHRYYAKKAAREKAAAAEEYAKFKEDVFNNAINNLENSRREREAAAEKSTAAIRRQSKAAPRSDQESSCSIQ